MTRPAQGRARLARAGFSDPALAESTLTDLGLWAVGAPTDEGADRVLVSLIDVTEPGLALHALQRVAAAAPDRQDLLATLRKHEGLRLRLLAVLGTSDALGDHLVAHPEHWHLLADDDATRQRPTVHGLAATLLAAVGVAGSDSPPWGTGGARAVGAGPEVIAALRTAYRGALLGLAARDLVGDVAVEDASVELADLAAATLTAALAVARAGLPEDLAPCRLAVIAMGKCGGRELNYVSDVDVVFVGEALPAPADSAGAARNLDEQAALRSATQLAAALMRVCAQVAWPVDAALRPEGGAGPLVRTLASHQAYYARWAKTWEFQALLKARPIAGDLELGRRYTEAVAPLVWTASGRQDFVEDVQRMRRRVEESIASDRTERELKLGRGGLRDVEFAVQLLQLVHGRLDERVRSGTTLVALEQLAEAGYIGREDARGLSQAYRWIRSCEHRLQLHHLRRTHLLPADEDEVGLRRIARAMGYRQDALAQWTRERFGYRHLVRRLHEKLFYRPLLDAVAKLPAEHARLGPKQAGARLAALGFADPDAALRNLQALTEGVSRRATIQQTLLPVMLGWFAAAADPDAGLLSYRRVSDALGTTPWYLRLLRDEGAAAERLAMLLATSRYVADMLVRAPESVKMLADATELELRSREALSTALVSVVRRRQDWEEAVIAARGMRRQELLRVACADLLGRADLAAVGRALSDITAATVEAALVTATREVEADLGRPSPVSLAIIAMGRLGGDEQSYGSDADVLFVHRARDGEDDNEASSVALRIANETRRLLAVPAPDPPLSLDADLRPEGKQGPFTRSLASYARYYEQWSLLWEAQALLRAAPLAGDTELTSDFLALADTVRFPAGGLSAQQLVEVRRLKARVENERIPRGVDPKLALKLGKGGLADVEWTVQLLQLQHGHQLPGLRTTSTLTALAAAAAAELLTEADAAELRAAWTMAARTRDALVLVRGKSSVALPSSGPHLDAVARCLGYGAGSHGQFLDDYRRATRHARQVVERVFYG